MVYPLFIEPEAERELEHAVNWYNKCRPGLGFELLECVDEVFERIRRPLNCTPWHTKTPA
jgi:hypothetical protein